MEKSKLLAVLASALGLVAMTSNGITPRHTDGRAASYVVQSATEAGAANAVESSGAKVVANLPIVAGVTAELTASEVQVLASEPGVHVTPDVPMTPAGNDYSGGALADQLSRMDLGGHWSGTAGAGVGVALIDTGVGSNPGLKQSHVVRSPDFSGENNTKDGYGHGTFMAGLIAGSGVGGPAAVPGAAPGVTLVSVKVATADGSTTLSDVIQGIGWAVEHRDAYNIRVMSISFGANFDLPPVLDPLDQAAEAAWASGITVVAAAGNDGPGHVTAPGDDPWVITVGAETTTGPLSVTSWSGSDASKPDVLAPGTSVTSLRDPGSLVDLANPQARVNGLYFRGSGTSMATALTAGAAALLIADHPDATPDDVKGALVAGSGPERSIDLAKADSVAASAAWTQTLPIGFEGGKVGSMPWAASSPSTTWAPSSMPLRWPSITWQTMSWEVMSWEVMSWETMSWETMSWETMSWEDEDW
jgi:serine protease AprX